MGDLLDRMRAAICKRVISEADQAAAWDKLKMTVVQEYEELSARLAALDGYARWMLDEFNWLGRPGTLPIYPRWHVVGPGRSYLIAEPTPKQPGDVCCGGGGNHGHEWNCWLLKEWREGTIATIEGAI